MPVPTSATKPNTKQNKSKPELKKEKKKKKIGEEGKHKSENERAETNRAERCQAQVRSAEGPKRTVEIALENSSYRGVQLQYRCLLK